MLSSGYTCNLCYVLIVHYASFMSDFYVIFKLLSNAVFGESRGKA